MFFFGFLKLKNGLKKVGYPGMHFLGFLVQTRFLKKPIKWVTKNRSFLTSKNTLFQSFSVRGIKLALKMIKKRENVFFFIENSKNPIKLVHFILSSKNQDFCVFLCSTIAFQALFWPAPNTKTHFRILFFPICSSILFHFWSKKWLISKIKKSVFFFVSGQFSHFLPQKNTKKHKKHVSETALF